MDTKKAIVLGADNNYRDKLETTIKSICYHNKDLKFYIFNEDIPKEWFCLMEKKLGKINCEILNIRIDAEKVKHFSTPNKHIRYMTYFRYFIPEIVEESRALYLDCDMIVHKPLDMLFEMSFDENYILAVRDSWDVNSFNAGMMVVNVDKWVSENICQQLLDLTHEKHQEVYGDQGGLNLLFKDKWKELTPYFDFMVGLDAEIFYEKRPDWFLQKWDVSYEPAIIHFEGMHKPWNHSIKTRYRELWWFYNGLDWQTILLEKDIKPTSFSDIAIVSLFHTAIFTDTQELEHIEYLVEKLPNVHFHIFAHSYFGSRVFNLEVFKNVSLYPNYTSYQSQEILSKLDFYLDINHYQEIDNILSVVEQLSNPIFAFENTSHDANNRSHIFSSAEPEKMVESIRQFLGE